MRILVVFDGSDDGLDGLRTIAKLLNAAEPKHEITITVVAWPPRPSPLWDRAFERQIVVDDLHRAMADIASFELSRLRELFSPLGAVETKYSEGDVTTEILNLIETSRAELLLVGVSRVEHARIIAERTVEVVQQSAIPTIVTFGAR